MELVEVVRAAGLGGRLADVYLALLRAGSASVLELAAQSGLKRTTVYDLLARLQERQLVTTGSRGRRRVFSARDPAHLRELPLEQARLLEEAIPLLHALQQAAPRRPRIQLYEGAEGVRRANDLLLELPIAEYHYFGSLRAMMELLGEKYLYGFVKRRIARGVWSNGIRSPDGELRHDFLRPGAKRLRRIRYFPSPLGPDVPALYIAGSHLVVSSSLREAYALVIESPGLSELLLAIWKVVWAVSGSEAGRRPPIQAHPSCPHFSQATAACGKCASAARICGRSFGAVLPHLAQGRPSSRRKASPEQAPVSRGASMPEGHISHGSVKYAG